MTERGAVHLAGVSHSWRPRPDPHPHPSTCGHLCPAAPRAPTMRRQASEASLILALGRPVTDQTCRRGGFRHLRDWLSRREVETVAADQHPSQPFAPPPSYR